MAGKEYIAERLSRARRKKELSQTALAERMGVPASTIFRIESGEIKDVGGNTLNKLADELGVTVDYLLGRTDAMTADQIISADSEAQALVKTFDSLSAPKKRNLMQFAIYLRKVRSA